MKKPTHIDKIFAEIVAFIAMYNGVFRQPLFTTDDFVWWKGAIIAGISGFAATTVGMLYDRVIKIQDEVEEANQRIGNTHRRLVNAGLIRTDETD
jgi:hypothetical protein